MLIFSEHTSQDDDPSATIHSILHRTKDKEERKSCIKPNSWMPNINKSCKPNSSGRCSPSWDLNFGCDKNTEWSMTYMRHFLLPLIFVSISSNPRVLCPQSIIISIFLNHCSCTPFITLSSTLSWYFCIDYIRSKILVTLLRNIQN